MNRLAVPAVAAAMLVPALLTACAASSAAGRAAAGRAAAAGPAVPVVKLSASCVTGIYDESRHAFYAMSGLIHGTGITPGDVIAEAYKLTLTDTSAGTAMVTGLSTAFYAEGRRLTTASLVLGVPAVLRPRRARSLMEYPWGTSVAGHGASVGPFRAGLAGAVNTAATCKLIRWSHAVRST